MICARPMDENATKLTKSLRIFFKLILLNWVSCFNRSQGRVASTLVASGESLDQCLKGPSTKAPKTPESDYDGGLMRVGGKP